MADPKVLILNSSVSGGGAGKALITLIQGLSAHPGDFHVMMPEDGVVGEDLRKLGVCVHYDPILPERFGRTWLKLPRFLRKRWIEGVCNVLLYPKMIFSVARLARKINADVICSNHQILSPVAVGAGKISRRAVILHSREYLTGLTAWYFNRLAQSKTVKKVIAVSQVSAKAYARSGKTTVIYDSVHPKVKQEDIEPLLRKELSLKNDALIVGFVGRIIERKGVDLLIEGFSKAAKDLPNVYLAIVGGNDPGIEYDLLAHYQELAKQQGVASQTLFLGFKKDPFPYIADFDILAMTSLAPEPFGLVPAEAMHYEIPPLVPDNSGASEVIVDQKTGVHFKAKDVDDFAKKLRLLLKNPELRDQLGTAAKTQVQEALNVQTQAKQVYSCLLDAMKAKASDGSALASGKNSDRIAS